MSFRVVMDAESRHIRVDASEKSNALSCLGMSKSDGKSGVESNATAKTDAPSLSANPVAEGKKSLAAKDYAHAVGFFTKAVTEGNASARQEGQELLGLARERAGQLAHAKAEYETYLKLYPKGAGAARVRQRLSGVEAAEQDSAEAQFIEHNKSRLGGAAVPGRNSVATDSGTANLINNVTNNGNSKVTSELEQPESNLGTKVSKGEPAPDPNAWTWEKNGSVSQYYYRDDSFSASDILRG
ncbi:MAG: tetratricopeptide repeat protein, partial [Aestuariivirga sp.]